MTGRLSAEVAPRVLRARRAPLLRLLAVVAAQLLLLLTGACARGDVSDAGARARHEARASAERNPGAERRPNGRARDDLSLVTLYASVDSGFAASVLRDFERQSGTRVRSEFRTDTARDAELADRVAPAGGPPRVDVFWSRDPVAAMELVRRGLAARYSPPNAETIPQQFKSADGRWTGFAAMGRVLLVNRTQVPDDRSPRSVRDLADPRWRGRVAMADPLAGDARLQVAAWLTTWGEDSAAAFLAALKRNRVRVAASERGVARLVSAGSVAVGLVDTDVASVALSSGAEVAVIYPDQEGMGTLLIPTVAVLLEGAPHPEAGRRLIDYLVSDESEQRIAQLEARVSLGSSYNHTPGLLGIDQIRPTSVDYAALAAATLRVRAFVGGADPRQRGLAAQRRHADATVARRPPAHGHGSPDRS